MRCASERSGRSAGQAVVSEWLSAFVMSVRVAGGSCPRSAADSWATGTRVHYIASDQTEPEVHFHVLSLLCLTSRSQHVTRQEPGARAARDDAVRDRHRRV